MNRKNFLSSLTAIGALGSFRAKASASTLISRTAQTAPSHAIRPPARPQGLHPVPLLIPPYLKPGDTIGITCPAGDITLKDIQP
ncbi:MAG TPA: hypothetical protein VN616_04160, partial [Puia sp.]|nr:hypothetical protein [Puia sp.]